MVAPSAAAGPQPAGHLTADSWQVTCVDCPKAFDAWTDRSLRLTAAGWPAAAYGGDHLYYAWHDGAAWQHAVVDDAPLVGASASLALTSAGAPCIAYYDAYNRDLKFAQWTPGGWMRQVVDGAGDAGAAVALALDRADRPHLAYYRENNDGAGRSLRHARWIGAQWEITTVAALTSTARFISIALDGADWPQISYYDTSAQDLHYIRWTGDAWEKIQVDRDGDVGAGSSLALDGDGHPHISYYVYDTVRGALRYAAWDGIAGHPWAIQVVDDVEDVGGYTSLALDGAGRPVISYRDFTHGDLKLARGAAVASAADGVAAWQIETVDAEGDVGAFTSLALDGAAQPRILYYDLSNNALRYAAWEGGVWNRRELDRAGRVGEYSALAFDAAGAPHISYQDSSREQLKYAAQIAGTWYNEVVDPKAGVGLYTSLALDEAGAAHISYQDGGEADLRYARQRESGWEIVVVDAAGDVGAHTSIGVDRSGWPHIGYYDATNATIKYAFRGAAGWTTEVVEQIGPLTYISLALDSAGAPHIAYYASSADGASGVLCYASRGADGGWQIKTVNGSADAGGHVSLALDAHDAPAISYYDFANPRVLVAVHGPEGWVTQVVTATGGESDTTLTLDRNGKPLAAFYDSTAGDLKFARPAAGGSAGWAVMTVARGGDVGAYPSLKVDGAGRPWISFYDVSNGDLLVVKDAGGAPPVFLPLVLRQ